jgi:hypothetical protein
MTNVQYEIRLDGTRHSFTSLPPGKVTPADPREYITSARFGGAGLLAPKINLGTDQMGKGTPNPLRFSVGSGVQ